MIIYYNLQNHIVNYQNLKEKILNLIHNIIVLKQDKKLFQIKNILYLIIIYVYTAKGNRK